MKIYDELIGRELMLLSDMIPKRLEYKKSSWPDDGNNGIVLKSDMAYELGGDNLLAISDMTMTGDEGLVPENELLLYGPDLCDISADAPYARLAIVRVDKDFDSENDMYNAVRKITYSKYHVHPMGFMARISAAGHREPVRVSKEALKKHISFSDVASMYLDKYLENPQVKAAKIIFITEPSFDYKALEELSLKTEGVTQALDHVMKNLMTDCTVCRLKPICDEVEGMKELHFGNAAKAQN